MPYSDIRHRLIFLLKQLGVAVLYALLAKIVLTFFSSNGVVSIVWPSSGLALAVLLIGGKRYFWSIFLGAFIANAMTGITLMMAVAIATGNTLEALLGTWLLTRNGRFDLALQSLRSYLLLVAAGSIGSICAALNGATVLLLVGFLTSENYLTNLAHWWMGDVLGVILITPLILVCGQTKNDWCGAKRVAEAALLFGLTFLVGQVILVGWFHGNIGNLVGHLARGAWMFLLVTGVALRLGSRGIVIAVLMMAVQALWGAYHGVGYFANDIARTQLVNYWLYMFVLSVNGMVLATFISGQKKADEVLRQSELKFRTLFDSTSDAVMLLDEKGFLDCNKATLEMIGCATKEEFCSKHPADLSPPEQPCGTSSFVLANQHTAAAMKEGNRRFEWVSKRADTGRIFLADVLLSAMQLEGKPVLQVVIRDITEQKRANEEFERFFNLIPDMACIASTDGHFRKVNRAWQTTLGYTEQEILATPFLDFIHPDDIDATMKEVGRQLAGEATLQFSNRYRCKDGSYKWLEWEATPAVDNMLLFASARDITERRHNEERLRQSKERLRAYLDNISDTVWVVHANLDIAYVSSGVTRLMGILPWEFIGRPSAMYIHPDDMVAIGNAMQYVMEHPGEPRTVQYRVSHKDGRWIHVESTGINLSDNPAINGVLVAMRDITERKYIEDELKLTKQRYDFATAVGKVGTWDWSPVTGVLVWSDETFRLMGLAPGSVAPSYELYLSLVHPDDRESLNSAVQAALHDKKPYDLDCRIVLGDGKKLVCHVAGNVEFDSGNQPTRMLGTIQDITERKQAETALQESEASMRAILDNSPYMVWLKDLEGRYIMANRTHVSYARMKDPSQIIGKTDFDLWPQEIAEKYRADDARVIATRRQKHIEDPSFDGDRVHWVETFKTPIIDKEGNVLGTTGFSRDITERKQTEAALVESHNLLNAVINAAPVRIFWKDRELRYLGCNPVFAKDAGEVSPQDVISKNDYQLGWKEQAELYRADDWRVMDSGIPKLAYEEPQTTPDGKTIWLRTSKVPLCNAGNETIGVLGVYEDITEQKQAERRLRDLSTHILEVREEEKARIAREIHDELGGTLTALKMDAYWLSRKLPANENTAAFAERIESMAQRIDNAVSVTRRVIADLRPSILDDLGLLAALEWQAAEFHKRSGVECRVNCIENEANLDNQRSIALFRILQETLTNISRHSGASKVEIKFHHGEHEVILIVSDNGCGIPENHPVTSKSYGMLGMTERVEQLGGRIIFSSPQGGGFIVAVTLPLSAAKMGS